MNIVDRAETIDHVLEEYRGVIGADFNAYRNHVYRVLNLCLAQGPLTQEELEKVQIAAAFHDIGIWSATTLDYLEPSAAQAAKYLQATGRGDWQEEVVQMIQMHHGLRTRAASAYRLVEVFRRADIADFSLGLFRMGLPRPTINAVRRHFPNAGFHRRLLQLGARWFLRHPLRPLPMFRL